ncbi:hypothetical protein ACFPRL_29915 [Pseudoclavibacter helvolus]
MACRPELASSSAVRARSWRSRRAPSTREILTHRRHRVEHPVAPVVCALRCSA